MDKKTKYSTLLTLFQKLHEKLKSTPAETLIVLLHTFKFTSVEHFKNALPHDDLQQAVSTVALQYPYEIIQLLSLLLQRFANGFENQKVQFTTLVIKRMMVQVQSQKIYKLSDEELNTLDNGAQTHNLGRKVGWVFSFTKLVSEANKI